ncbi:hypothetical protein SLS60_008496 [Paraconiothyrium brasiliense]|uniref:Uncharacterized protein n=1 Tax=Paraconiothyrium brasiliense TaxID=300254 RepID=A0ABR3R130_9PLEO
MVRHPQLMPHLAPSTRVESAMQTFGKSRLRKSQVTVIRDEFISLTLGTTSEYESSLSVGKPLALSSEAEVSKRTPGRAQSGRKKTSKRPNKRPANPPSKTSKRPSRPPIKKPTRPTKPQTQKPSHATKGSVKSHSATPSTKPVRPLPYARPPRPTKGFDVCNLPNFGCITELDDFEDTSALSKRASSGSEPGEPRDYDVKFSTGEVIKLWSKSYYTSLDLFSTQGLHMTPAYADYAVDDIRKKDVRVFNSPQTRDGEQSSYVTEHIVELQTVARFIETVTKTPNRNRDAHPVKLSKTVNTDFFVKQFKKPYPRRVADRPLKPNNQVPSDPPNRSIMNNVFEALGSKKNAEDFVLCESGINMVKMRLWSNFHPANPKRYKDIAKDASVGAIPSNEHLSMMRAISRPNHVTQVLAVFSYMDAVEDRMDNSIQNVKTELSKTNIQYIVQQDEYMPHDEHGNVVDLGPLWQEYMQKLLARFQRKGIDFLDDQIKTALPLYEAEETRLQKYVRRFEDERKESNSGRKSALKNDRIKKGNDYKQRLKPLVKKLEMAVKQQKLKEKQLKTVIRTVLAIKDKEKQKQKKTQLNYRAVKKASEDADVVMYGLQKEVGLMRRKIDQQDEDLFKALIKDVRDDVAQLKAYQKATKTLEVKLAREEARLKSKYGEI